MSDFNKPDNTTEYADCLSLLRALIAVNATMFYDSDQTNIPDQAVRFSRTNRRFEYWSEGSAAWLPLVDSSSTYYAMNVEKLQGKTPSDFAAASHTHDGRYFTEDEVTALLAAKAAASHIHDERYFTETEANDAFAATLVAGSTTIILKDAAGNVHSEITVPRATTALYA